MSFAYISPYIFIKTMEKQWEKNVCIFLYAVEITKTFILSSGNESLKDIRKEIRGSRKLARSVLWGFSAGW